MITGNGTYVVAGTEDVSQTSLSEQTVVGTQVWLVSVQVDRYVSSHSDVMTVVYQMVVTTE